MLAKVRETHAAALERERREHAAALEKATASRAARLEKEHAARVKELKQVHAADLEARSASLHTTRRQLRDASAQVAELRANHERSESDARHAADAARAADAAAREQRRAAESSIKALQDAVSLAVASGASEDAVRNAMREHGVELANRDGRLVVQTPRGKRTTGALRGIARALRLGKR